MEVYIKDANQQKGYLLSAYTARYNTDMDEFLLNGKVIKTENTDDVEGNPKIRVRYMNRENRVLRTQECMLSQKLSTLQVDQETDFRLDLINFKSRIPFQEFVYCEICVYYEELK